jgi:hypothetical protein
MSITRFTTVLLALVTALALASNAGAQLFKPLAFPPYQSDFQFFAPGCIDTYGGGPKHKTGWFATFDRIYMNVGRPDRTFEGYTSRWGDFTWGNRFDLGFVEDDSCKGWTATIWHINGPNQEDILRVERLNRTSDGSPQGDRIRPIIDNNLRLTGDRDYLVTNSVNVADMTGFELHRTWLLKPLHHGARITPFAGFRYTRFIDFYQRQTYDRYDENGFLMPPDGIPGIISTTATTEQLTSLDAGVINDMVGGQLGIHWDRDYRQWNFSGDVKAFAMQNFQVWDSMLTTETTVADGALGDPSTVLHVKQGEDFNTAEFVWGGEVRVDAAYRVTRDLSLRFGFEFLHFGKGIGRGIDTEYTSQDVVMYGVGLGIAYNR